MPVMRADSADADAGVDPPDMPAEANDDMPAAGVRQQQRHSLATGSLLGNRTQEVTDQTIGRGQKTASRPLNTSAVVRACSRKARHSWRVPRRAGVAASE